MSNEPLGPQISYVDLLDIQTYKASREEERKIKEEGTTPFNPFRPSSLGKCTRELAYQGMEFTGQSYYNKELREPNITRLLSVGHFIEDSLIDQFEKFASEYFQVKYKQHQVEGFEVTSEEFDELNFRIEGSMDWCFWSPETKGLIDAKTKKDKFSKFYRSAWDEDDEKLSEMETTVPINDSDKAYWIEDVEAFLEEMSRVDKMWEAFFAPNFWQLNFYACTPWARGKGIDHAAIVQYNKNDSRIREIRFKPSMALYERARVKVQGAVDAVSTGDPKAAPRDFTFGSPKCAFCPYAQDCWSEEDKTSKQAFFDTFPNKAWQQDTGRLGKSLAQELEKEYETMQEGEKVQTLTDASKERIIKLMLDNGLKKIKFSDGKVYQLKYLKSPRAHYELRRTKL